MLAKGKPQKIQEPPATNEEGPKDVDPTSRELTDDDFDHTSALEYYSV